MHIKKISMPKTWPVKRKEKARGKYVVVQKGGKLEKSLPLLVVLRDMLGIVNTRKEAKKLLLKEKIIVSGKRKTDERSAVQLFDTLVIPKIGFFRLSLAKKLFLEQISQEEASKKICKIIGKKMLKGKKIQLNLEDGRNYISDIKAKVGDSLLIDLMKNEIISVLPLKEGAKVFVAGGKHSGIEGKIKKINKEIIIETKKEIIKANKKNVIVVE